MTEAGYIYRLPAWGSVTLTMVWARVADLLALFGGHLLLNSVQFFAVWLSPQDSWFPSKGRDRAFCLTFCLSFWNLILKVLCHCPVLFEGVSKSRPVQRGEDYTARKPGDGDYRDWLQDCLPRKESLMLYFQFVSSFRFHWAVTGDCVWEWSYQLSKINIK